MAFPDEDDLGGRRSGARRRRDRRMPSPEPLDENDWSAESEDDRRPTPYRNREAKREMTERTESRPSSQHHAREPSSQQKPNAAMSVSRRPSAVPRRARDPHLYEHTSGTDSRRSSRKENSPRYHISTPASKRSSHTTVSDSDEESAQTPSTEDDEPVRVPIQRQRESPKRESPHQRQRRSGSRQPTKPKALLVPKVPEIAELVDSSSEEEDEDSEDESEDEDTEEDEEEEEQEIAIVPKLRTRPSRVLHIHEEEDIPSPSPPRHRGRHIQDEEEEDIPLPSPSRRRNHVEHLFDPNFKRTWERRFIENSARSGHLYCPARKCGAWIHPENIYTEYGRDRGHCSRCRTKVCGSCNQKWHSSRDCRIGEAAAQILEHPRDQVFVRCYRCKTMVELKEGCDHMIW
ncbi:uncharacterized protein DNG_08603 [Cephalotrichum gorgonifer]|uniref:RING-type domain-containing protein n=1 Tax=Cephalotrichum gorgonifer TaxID=2041049 RepID=A0AAE8N5K5_9PEZI|nr:uncharacterized protein DNG_08603 [Cephalotrichum gorgonifer]